MFTDLPYTWHACLYAHFESSHPGMSRKELGCQVIALIRHKAQMFLPSIRGNIMKHFTPRPVAVCHPIMDELREELSHIPDYIIPNELFQCGETIVGYFFMPMRINRYIPLHFSVIDVSEVPDTRWSTRDHSRPDQKAIRVQVLPEYAFAGNMIRVAWHNIEDPYSVNSPMLCEYYDMRHRCHHFDDTLSFRGTPLNVFYMICHYFDPCGGS
jgi:hypothetical protein